MIKRGILIIGLVLSGFLSAAQLKVGVSFAIPPYVIEKEAQGIELDLRACKSNCVTAHE